ncbi:hypothetical protein BG006_000514, partial [Podila minutissima]
MSPVAESPEKRKTRGAAKRDEEAKKKPTKKPTRADKGKAKAVEPPEPPKKTRAKPIKILTKPAKPEVKSKKNEPTQMKTRIKHAIKANPDPKGPTRTRLRSWINTTFNPNPGTLRLENYSIALDFDETLQREVDAGRIHFTTGNHQRVEMGPSPNAPESSSSKKAADKKKTTLKKAAPKKAAPKKGVPKKAAPKK